jgi:hypothetical protein
MYFHSWGLSSKYAIFPNMHFSMDIFGAMSGKTVSELFKPEDMTQSSTTITLLPLDGSSTVEFTIPGHMYYTHSVNAFEMELEGGTAVVYDVVTFQVNPLQAAALDMFRNVTARDSQPEEMRGQVGECYCIMPIMRFSLHFLTRSHTLTLSHSHWWGVCLQVKRLTLFVTGPYTGTARVEELSKGGAATDFSRKNDAYSYHK